MKTSRPPKRATTFSSGWIKSRLATITNAIAATPLAASSQPLAAPVCSGANSGNSAISGMTAKSWNSRMAKAPRPGGVLSSPRSPSQASTMAVEDIASPKPTTNAAGHPRPSARASSISAIPEAATCAPPMPNTG